MVYDIDTTIVYLGWWTLECGINVCLHLPVERHYGLNRFNRKTVREDIPVARIVQSDEEVRQQQERYEQIMALQVQYVQYYFG